jgi:hypothetical protein
MYFTLLVIITCSPTLFANQFIGSWQLVSGEYVDHNNKLVNYSDLKLSSLKVISSSHFSFVTKADEKFWSAGAGRYQFTDTLYIEMPASTSYELEPNAQYQFTYKIEGDTWHNERWKNDIRVEYEVWQRVN